MFKDLEKWLCEVTGYDKISLQPNSGAAGEYTGLLTIRKYLDSLDQHQRNVTHMANMKVVVVSSDKHGNINYKDLAAKV
ncbi:unnamed protein product [Cylicostephanus goldi]|uniref:Uncharacterized protein n=1 Tax=Cylicostephanus goldi TaxID=71465 RepID=A0A3P7QRB3_CYLGO|nr:unnamed protein product [Cylicostephanus goldi]